MRSLARKISRAKWEAVEAFAPDEIGADAVTSCLRTTGNALSLWECDADADDIRSWTPGAGNPEVEAVVLALASSMDSLASIDILLLSREAIEATGLRLLATPEHGLTPVEDLKPRHVDLTALDLVRLSMAATLIAGQVRGGGAVRRFRSVEIVQVLQRAIADRRLAAVALRPSLQAKVVRTSG